MFSASSCRGLAVADFAVKNFDIDACLVDVALFNFDRFGFGIFVKCSVVE